MVVLCTFCALLSILTATRATILRYDVEMVHAGNTTEESKMWAEFVDHGAPAAESVSLLGVVDGGHHDLTLSSPFFSSGSVRWYVSPYVFLTTSPLPLCTSFCTKSVLGTLLKDGEIQTGVGTRGMSMIAPYVADLSPSKTVNIFPRARAEGVVKNTYCQIVEYTDVVVKDCPSEGNTMLTTQIEVCTDGTIVMRYKKLPKCGMVTAGIALSDAERSNYTFDIDRDVSAIRYKPVSDNCSRIETELECFNGEDCLWCGSTGTCVSKLIANLKAPSGTCYNASRLLHGYYNVSISQRSGLHLEETLRFSKVATTSSVVFLSLGFNFPFYTKNQKNRRTSLVNILASGVISVFSDRQDCEAVRNLCTRGNYSYAIMPLAANQNWASGTSVAYAPVGKRTKGDLFCEEISCPQGIVIELSSKSLDFPLVSYKYLVYLDKSGVIEFRYGSNVNYFLEHTGVRSVIPSSLFIGVSRLGVDDDASIMIPNARINEDTRIRFEPSQKCNDCGPNGRCDLVDGNCTCFGGYRGPFCDDCPPGYYGPKCLECPKCKNGGKCDDGRRGSGGCKCNAPYSGRTCAKLCKRPFDCSACNPFGGYCSCGVCRCHKKLGWSGPHCNTSNDPCRRLSFSGCEACRSDTANWCAFCSDLVCYSKKLEGTKGEYKCIREVTDQKSPLCTIPEDGEAEVRKTGSGSTVLIILSVIFLLLFAYAVHRLITGGNVVDLQVANAVNGTPDYFPPRREREVMQVSFIAPKSLKGKKYALGVPLKQISLRKLYDSQKRQLGRSKEGADF